nr:hypothetical protein GCM10020092_018640 [Actinoplanes digitatis]
MLDGHLVVGDPLAGRGTTLNQALMYGYDAVGVEIDGKDVEAYKLFLQTWLKRKRLKHTAELVPVRRQGRRAARRLEITMAASKEDHKAGVVQRLTVLNADTTALDGLIRANTVDVLVADLPYGVAHGSYDDEGGMSRRPLDLLERAVPQWLALLRPGGAIGLSWNTKVARRELAEDILLANGLDLVVHEELSHRVDQGIERDVVVARKKRLIPAASGRTLLADVYRNRALRPAPARRLPLAQAEALLCPTDHRDAAPIRGQRRRGRRARSARAGTDRGGRGRRRGAPGACGDRHL